MMTGRQIAATLLSWILAAPTAFAAGSGDGGDTPSRGVLIDSLSTMIFWIEDQVFQKIEIFGTDVQLIVLWLLAPMVILTVYFNFINLRSFKTAYRIVRGEFHDPTAPGDVTQFQALATALSGTVGLGNIAGVAVAIGVGGPGATFWMILIGFCAMSLKFAECTLGVKYRKINDDGTISGGPMYYLERGLSEIKRPKTGRMLALTYAGIAVIATVPQITQANQAYSQISGVIGVNTPTTQYAFGIILCLLTAVVIIGGIKSIAQVTSRLVPLMAGIYITAALVILIGSADAIPAAIVTIFDGAFNPDKYVESVSGGFLGVIVIGMRRAVYSTEAGLGTATMAHAAAKTREPVSEGMVALMEPFVDTVVICTITALVIVVTGAYTFKGVDGEILNDVQMTSAAFGSVISWFPYVLVGAVSLFAFSTVIAWGYYSSRVWGFVFGDSTLSMNIFKVTFCALLIPSGVFSADEVFSLIDSLYFLMAIPNVIGIYFMAPTLKRDIASYLERLKSGEIKSNTEAARAG